MIVSNVQGAMKQLAKSFLRDLATFKGLSPFQRFYLLLLKKAKGKTVEMGLFILYIKHHDCIF